MQKFFNKTPAKKIFNHEMIERSESFQKDFLAWQFSDSKKAFLELISIQFGLYQNLPDEVISDIDFLSTSSSKGFVINFVDKNYSIDEVVFLFDYLKLKVLKEEYRISISDRRVSDKGKGIEIIERHYLKPKHKKGEKDKIDQQFGNISIILTTKESKPFNLKCSATAYPDRMFAKARPFEDFMEIFRK